MEYGIVIILCALAVGYLLYLLFRRKSKKEPHDTYVCDVCGEKECLCHKVETKK